MRFVALGAVLILATTTVASAETSGRPQSTGAKVLNRWLGRWKSFSDLKATSWSPIAVKRSESTTGESVMKGQYLQLITRSATIEARSLIRYEKTQRVYQRWTFDSAGATGFWTGKWNAESKTMVWTMDLGAIKGTITDKFTAADAFSSRVLIKDRSGKALLDIRTTHAREKQKAGEAR